MNELDLYKFLTDCTLEIDWRGEELVAWIYPFHIQKFAEMCGNYLSTGEKVVLFEDGIVAIDLVPICEHFDIDPERICEKGE